MKFAYITFVNEDTYIPDTCGERRRLGFLCIKTFPGYSRGCVFQSVSLPYSSCFLLIAVSLAPFVFQILLHIVTSMLCLVPLSSLKLTFHFRPHKDGPWLVISGRTHRPPSSFFSVNEFVFSTNIGLSDVR